jgi:hypothetical protein
MNTQLPISKKYENIPIISWDIYDPEQIEKNIGHSIIIPEKIMYDILKTHNTNEPVYIEIRDMNGPKQGFKNSCLVFANTETTLENVCVVPRWALDKLAFSPMDYVSITSVYNIRKTEYIKLQADKSDYVYWNELREILEQELSKFQCISMGDIIVVFDIRFTVVELRDAKGIRMLDGSLYKTDVKLDFNTPDDIVREEMRQQEEQKRLEELARQAKEIEERRRQEELIMADKARFPGQANILSEESAIQSTRISREQMAAIIEARLKTYQ